MTNNYRFMSKAEMLSCAEKAFEEKQFCVFYQPQVNHSNKRMVGAEALVRWIHPEYGMMSPVEFIPLFEENGLVTRLDLYVFEELCGLLGRCLENNMQVVPISFNVSRHDLFSCDFIEKMEDIRKKYNIPVEYLRVEITESAAVEGSANLKKRIDSLHSLGYVVEMDDFGSGYSSLNFLKEIDVDIIKLDMIFLRGDIGGRGGVIISSVVSMANWLGTPVIAEGVETEEQADYMRSIGCDHIQGYLYSMPVPEKEFIEKLSSVRIASARPGMNFIDKLDTENFWNPNSLETMVFNNFVGGAAIFSFENGKFEVIRVNEKYLKELGMNMSQKDVIFGSENIELDDENKSKYIETVKRAIESDDEEVCETWRKVLSPCCGEDRLCIKSTMRVIGRAESRFLIYVMIQNITVEKKLYAELYDNEKKFRTAGEHANIYAWEYLIDTKEMFPCSRCKRDLAMPDVVKNYPEPVIESGLFPAEYADMYRDWHRQLAEGAQKLEAIIPLTKDRVPFHVRYTAEFDENGRPYKAYASATLVVDNVG